MSTTNSGWTQAAIIAGNAAVQGYTARQAAKEQQKVAKEAAKPRYEMQYRLPYMNEMIAPLIPYILQSQQQVFQNRMKGYGSQAPDFSPIASLLAGLTSNYSGVPQMGGGQTYGGRATGGANQSFPWGGASIGVSPRMTAEQFKELRAAGEPPREGGARGGYGAQNKAEITAGDSYGGYFNRGMRMDPVWMGMMAGARGTPGASEAGDWLEDTLRNGAYWYANLDNNIGGGKAADLWGMAKEGGVNFIANNVIPFASLGGKYVDNNIANPNSWIGRWATDYNDPDRMSATAAAFLAGRGGIGGGGNVATGSSGVNIGPSGFLTTQGMEY